MSKERIDKVTNPAEGLTPSANVQAETSDFSSTHSTDVERRSVSALSREAQMLKKTADTIFTAMMTGGEKHLPWGNNLEVLVGEYVFNKDSQDPNNFLDATLVVSQVGNYTVAIGDIQAAMFVDPREYYQKYLNVVVLSPKVTQQIAEEQKDKFTEIHKALIQAEEESFHQTPEHLVYQNKNIPLTTLHPSLQRQEGLRYLKECLTDVESRLNLQPEPDSEVYKQKALHALAVPENNSRNKNNLLNCAGKFFKGERLEDFVAFFAANYLDGEIGFGAFEYESDATRRLNTDMSNIQATGILGYKIEGKLRKGTSWIGVGDEEQLTLFIGMPYGYLFIRNNPKDIHENPIHKRSFTGKFGIAYDKRGQELQIIQDIQDGKDDVEVLDIRQRWNWGVDPMTDAHLVDLFKGSFFHKVKYKLKNEEGKEIEHILPGLRAILARRSAQIQREFNELTSLS